MEPELGSVECPNCGAASDEPCAEWCAMALTEGSSVLTAGIEKRLAGSVPNPSVSALENGETKCF